MLVKFDRLWKLAPSCVALLVILLLGSPVAHGEMRKSWQAKSGDTDSQLLKTARLEDPPSAKPPEPSVEMRAMEESTTRQPTTAVFSPSTVATEATTVARAPEEVKNKSTQFSSRVRSKYGVVKPVATAKPTENDPQAPEERERAVPLHLEHNPDEIQVDDATVQDDDEDDDEDDEEDGGSLGWEAEKHDEEFDLIENILEELDERVTQDKRPAGRPSEHSDASEAAKRKPEERTKEYTFPPVLNMTIDEPNSIVRVKLNQEVVRDMLSTGRESGGIGGKKMLRYILPLFILPFLIQSAVIPFMLTTVKLFLLKSLMAGKLAIFLLLLGAFKNFTKKERDVYVKDVPDRRYEPSSEGFAYLSEGRPSNWVN